MLKFNGNSCIFWRKGIFCTNKGSLEDLFVALVIIICITNVLASLYLGKKEVKGRCSILTFYPFNLYTVLTLAINHMYYWGNVDVLKDSFRKKDLFGTISMELFPWQIFSVSLCIKYKSEQEKDHCAMG